jgi:hypothetical protein
MFRDFLGYSSGIFRSIGAGFAFFPFANELLKIMKLPLASHAAEISAANTLVCGFVLMLAYYFGSRNRGAIRLTVFTFLFGCLCLWGFFYVIAPSQAMVGLGLSVAVAEAFGPQDYVILFFYFATFISFTGAFNLLAANLYPG